MGDGGGDGGGGRIFPEHPSPILHAPRDNISRKDNPSLRYSHISIIAYGSLSREWNLTSVCQMMKIVSLNIADLVDLIDLVDLVDVVWIY